MRARPPARRFLSGVIWTGFVLAAAASGAAARSGWPHLEEARSLFEYGAGKPVVVEYAALGPGAAPTLWAVLSGQALSEEDLDLSGGRLRAVQAIDRWRGEAVVEHLLGALRPETTLTDRLVLVDLLAATGSSAALPGTFTAFDGVDPIELRSERAAVVLRRSMATLLAGQPRRFYDLADFLPQVPPTLLPVVIESVGSTPDAEAVLVLSRALSVGEHVERDVLRAIAGRGAGPRQASSSECVDLARRYLGNTEHVSRRLAVQALGRLRDVDSFPDIVERLDDSDPVVRRLALETLQQLSGRARAWDADRWQRLWETERTWLDQALGLSGVLAHGDAYGAAQAVSELGAHVLFARDVAELMARGLEHADADVRALTCEGLAHLAHPRAIPDLIHALDDHEARVRYAAHAALVALTGLEHPREAAEWRSWWDSQW